MPSLLPRPIALSLALALAAPMALTAVPAIAQALAPAVGKPLQQASNAAKAGNVAAAQNYVNQARSAATTPNERTKVAQMAAFVHTRGGNYAAAAAELERIGAPASQLAPLYYQARQYDKAIAAARRSGQTTIVAQSYLMQGKADEAAKIYADLVQRNPSNLNYLSNLAGAQFRAGDKAGYLATTQRLIRLDPSPARWNQLLSQIKANPMSRDAKLGLYHLMRETGTLTSATDVQEMAKIAIVGGQPGVAADVVRTAAAAGTLPAGDAMTNRLVEAATKRQQAALQTAPAQARAANTALQAGHAFLGAGMYPQAVAAYGVAMRGPNPGEAALFQGIAHVRAGNAPAARKSFGTIPAGNALADMGNLWSLFASTRA